MRKSILLVTSMWATLALGPAAAQAAPEVAPVARLGIHSLDTMTPNGEYVVSIFTGSRWQEVGTLTCDRFFRERRVDLSPYVSSLKTTTVTIRLQQRGGGAAHIDSVLLGGLPPTGVRVKGSDARLAVQKVSQRDNDVIDAFHKTCEVVFPSQGKDAVLKVTARVEGVEISKTPFRYPRENMYREMTSDSRFYPYTLTPHAGTHTSLFTEYSRTGTGHPSGYTYGWATNDAKNLYVTLDFTPDNTRDGAKDYAAVYAKTAQGLKEFRVSEPERRWGRPRFTYTDTVAYQHKVYEFTIPLKELGVTGGKKGTDLLLAFSAYGTAGPGDYNPSVAYDSQNNQFLVVYTKLDVVSSDIYGQFLYPNGTAMGLEFIISNAGNGQYVPSAAYDSVNQRFLVAWEDYRSGTNYDIYGQVVNAGGTLYGAGITSGVNFTISNAASDQYYPSVAYDSMNQRYLVTWQDYRSGTNYDIYGQVVNADGTLFGTTSGVNFTISNAASDQYYPSVAYDSMNQRYLVTWQDCRSGPCDIYGQMVNGDGTLFSTTSGTNFTISNAMYTQSAPTVAYDSMNQRYLVAWEDYRSGTNYDIYGQVVNAGGTLYGAGITSGVNFTISDAANYQIAPSVAYDSVNQRFLVAWYDLRSGTNYDIYGQVVNADGTLFGTTSGVNFTISDAPGSQYNPSAAYNPLCGHFLVAYQDTGVVPVDIAVSRVGSACETTPPAVVSTTPANGATGVDITTALSATFSEAMRSSTITSGVWSVAGASGAISYDAGTRTATFTPTTTLAYGTPYTATITTGARDVVGNALPSPYTWSFTTMVPPAAPLPPGGGGKGGCGCVISPAHTSRLGPLGTLILCGVVIGVLTLMRRKRA